MRLSEILKDTDYEFVAGNDIEVVGIAYNSQLVQSDYLFVCVTGFKTDGHRFAKSACESGATALLVEDDTLIGELVNGVTLVKVKNTRKALATASANFYNNAHKKLRITGVTGTNGKTSTTYMLAEILRNSGRKVGLIGTIENRIGDRVLRTERTTPESLELHQLFSQMVDEGVQDVVMEVSSHSLELYRVHGIHFEVALFTNLTQDHLDFHKTMEDYLYAKAKLFKMCTHGVLNLDDMWAQKIINESSCSIKTFSIEAREANVQARNISISNSGVRFTALDGATETEFEVPIAAMFAIYNTLGVISAGTFLGVEYGSMANSLKDFKGVPGRATTIKAPANFRVIVDYAHSPDGLSNILKAAKEQLKGKLITVFGCGGDRDSKKRPIMGQIAGELSDYVIVTSDNPRTEDPEKIISDIEAGLKTTRCEYTKITDRREAIRSALSRAIENDVVVIAGKGHEDYQIFKDKTVHFDDAEEVREALK